MKRLSFIVVLLLSIGNITAQEIKLPSIIGDNMVVRRNSTAKIWGWTHAADHLYIVADWNLSDTVRVKADECAKFETEIKTPEAGGPYSIKIIGSNAQTILENVMVGEVWLCGGQSNMQMSMGNTYGTKVEYADEISKINNSNIRIFTVPRIGADYPQIDCDGEWEKCNSKSALDVSLAAYFFAQKLQKELNVPIGVVSDAWGGTNAETWIPERAIADCPEIIPSVEGNDKTEWWPLDCGKLYNGMIAPLVPFNFSGAIWYQGESNIVVPEYYDTVMKTLIDSWREDFNKDMPFYFAQIAPFKYNGRSSNNSAYLREQQVITSSYEGCGMIVLNDVIDDTNNIHPADKKSVGYRFADIALNRTYNLKEYICNYPEIDKVSQSKGKLIITIKNCPEGFSIIERDNSGFKIAAKDGNFVDAKMEMKDNTIILSAKEVKEPIYVRYLFDDASICTVKSNNGLPLIPYRNY